GAVGIEHPHPRIGHLGWQDQDQTIGSHAEMPVAHGHRQAGGVRRRRLGEGVDVDVIVADPVHLGEFHNGAAERLWACNVQDDAALPPERAGPRTDYPGNSRESNTKPDAVIGPPVRVLFGAKALVYSGPGAYLGSCYFSGEMPTRARGPSMLGTSTTPYDLRFRFLDIPVRIHPLFWLMAAVLGFRENDIPAVLIWIGCVLVSILVHEYGHGLMAKHFHGSPSIVLYGLGGLCSSQGERTPGQRLAVLFAGPGAGFILCAVVLAATSLVLGITGGEHLAVMQRLVGLSPNKEDLFGATQKLVWSPTAFEIYFNMIWINLLWGLVNLLPIYPLDGGQATQVVLSQVDRRHGVRRAHI